MDKVTEAIQAWEAGKCSNIQLVIAIKATEETLNALRAFGCNWVMLVGLQNTLSSMKSSMESRLND